MNHKALAGAGRPLEHQRAPAREARHEAWTLQAVARAKQGDRSAVRYLYNRHAPTVRHYAASLLRDADLVDDVVQTTFLKLITKLHTYEPREVPFEAWLLRVARNVAYDELRRRRSRDSVPYLEHDAAAGVNWDGADVHAALDDLPPAWREVLVLRHVVGLSTTEIADRLGTDRRSVATLLERASTSLRGKLRGPVPDGFAAELAARPRPPHRPLVQRLG